MGIDPTLAFLDADVLAQPVTRTLLLLGSDAAGFQVTWSEYVEQQANRHQRPQATSVTAVREDILERELSPTGVSPERFTGTQEPDRQVLADVEAAGAGYLITSDVDDFAAGDLSGLSISAVNPDLFMSARFDGDTYVRCLKQLVSNMKHPSRTVAEMHSLIARRHPRLFACNEHLFSVAPSLSGHGEPAVMFRGARCVRCGTLVPEIASARWGLGPECYRFRP